MRVIAGKYRSRPLGSLRGLDLRPTADRLRETLFNVLTAGNPLALEGTVWLDLYAGTGAVGIEALSRGADKVYFVESSPRVVELIRKNLSLLDITTGFEILKQDVCHALAKFEKNSMDFAFLDPPYRMRNEYQRTLESLGGSRWLKENGLVIAEHDKKFDPGQSFGPLQRVRQLKQGDAALSFYRYE